jgi:hypothetical protein
MHWSFEKKELKSIRAIRKGPKQALDENDYRRSIKLNTSIRRPSMTANAED